MGPACMSAGILDVGRFRKCSYPLDWGQSGSSILEPLFTYPSDQLYYEFFHSPKIRLSTLRNEQTNSFYAKEEKPLYGFPYFLNPHRPQGLSMDYHLRCINRFKSVVSNPLIRKEFLFSDRLDNPGETYFHNITEAVTYIRHIINQHVLGTYNITVCRIGTTNSSCIDIERTYLPNICVISLRLPPSLSINYYHPYAIAACFPSSLRHNLLPVNYSGHSFSNILPSPLHCCTPQLIKSHGNE